MGLRTYANLVANARARADMQDDGNFIADDPELERYINDAWGELWDILINGNPSIFSKTLNGTLPDATIPAGGDELSHALPGDFYKLLGLAIQGGSGAYRHAVPSHEDGRVVEAKRLYQSTSHPVYTMRYDASTGGWRLFIYPETAGSKIMLEYIPEPLTLGVGDVESLYVPSTWAEFIEIAAAIRMVDKEAEMELSMRLEQHKMALTGRIQDHVRSFDVSAPPRVRDIDGRFDDSDRVVY